MKDFCAFLIILTVSSSCSSEVNVQKGDIYRVPLLKECESVIRKSLDNFSSDLNFNYRVIKYDHIAISNPSVVGFVELSGLEKDALSRRANSFILDCYPNNETTIVKNDSLGEEIKKVVSINKRIGSKKIYFVDKENTIDIIYRIPK